ncbi:MAG: hypothetical protein JJT85_11990 [Chromatiales bacterium]|nr:hypothetical protein [Chromatiales bacterium]
MQDSDYSRRGAKWSEEEQRSLQASFEQGMTINELARRHGRTPIAIRTRLMAIGAIRPVFPTCYTPFGGLYECPYDVDDKGGPIGRDHVPWCDEELQFLRDTHQEGITDLKVLSDIHRRSPVVIEYWLRQQGLLPPIWEHEAWGWLEERGRRFTEGGFLTAKQAYDREYEFACMIEGQQEERAEDYWASR